VLATVLFTGFIAFLYLPSQFFRFWANVYADLRRRRTSSQLEDFLGASIPSSLLNVIALIVWGAGSNVTTFFGRDWMPLPVTKTVFSVFTALSSAPSATPNLLKQHEAALLHAMPRLGLYWCFVMTGAVVFGLWYGATEHSLARAGGIDKVKGRYPTWGHLWKYWQNPPVYGTETIKRTATARYASEKFLWFIRLFFHRLWDLCFFTHKNFIYPWAAKNSRVFLKMKPGHIVFGVLKSYVHSNDGGVDGVMLWHVQRFDAETLKETALAGKNPFRKLVGPLFVKWDEVLDVNFPPPKHILRLRRLYLRIYRHARRKAAAEKNRSLISRMWHRVRRTRPSHETKRSLSSRLPSAPRTRRGWVGGTKRGKRA
jgi:hypothetical protein